MGTKPPQRPEATHVFDSRTRCGLETRNDVLQFRVRRTARFNFILRPLILLSCCCNDIVSRRAVSRSDCLSPTGSPARAWSHRQPLRQPGGPPRCPQRAWLAGWDAPRLLRLCASSSALTSEPAFPGQRPPRFRRGDHGTSTRGGP